MGVQYCELVKLIGRVEYIVYRVSLYEVFCWGLYIYVWEAKHVDAAVLSMKHTV